MRGVGAGVRGVVGVRGVAGGVWVLLYCFDHPKKSKEKVRERVNGFKNTAI